MNSLEIQLDPRDFKDVTQLPLQNEESSLWINTVFNITREGILPARFLRGFLPAFKLAEDIRRISDGRITPTVRVFQPIHFSTFTDDVDEDVVKEQQELGISCILAMSKRHFPLTEVLVENDQPFTDKAEEILVEVASLIDPPADLLDRLKRSGRKWGGELGEARSLIYGAHHPFGWSDLFHPAFFEACPPRVVVNSLPPAEKKFTLIRGEVLEKVPKTPLARLVREGVKIDLPLNISGAHYICIRSDETRRILEPDLRLARTLCCEDVLELMQTELGSLRSGSTKSNLKKAFVDLQVLMEDLSGVKIEDLRGVSFQEIIGGEI